MCWSDVIYKFATANRRKEQMSKRIFSRITTLSLTIRVYFIRLDVAASQIWEIPQNSPKTRAYSSSRSSKVIDLGVNRQRICDFPLVINSNFGRIFCRFWDINAFSSEIACFPSHPCLMQPCGGTPYNINIICTSMKSAFSGLQFDADITGICIRLAVVASQSRKISRNCDKIWPYSSSTSSKVIDLGVNRKLICDFLLAINSRPNFGCICYRFRDIDA